MRYITCHINVAALVCLLLLPGCRKNVSHDEAVGRLNGSDSVDVNDQARTAWSVGCSFGLLFSDSVRFNTPPELPIGYLAMVHKRNYMSLLQNP